MKTIKTYMYTGNELLDLIKRSKKGEEILPYEWKRVSRNWKQLKYEKSFLKRFFIYFDWKEILSNYREAEYTAEYNEIFKLIFNNDPVDEQDQVNILKKYKLPKYDYMYIDRQKSIDAYYYCRSAVQKIFCEHNLTEDMFDNIMSNKKILNNELVREALIKTKILFPDKKSLEMLKIICAKNTFQIELLDLYKPKFLNKVICKYFKEFSLNEIYKLLYHSNYLTPESKGLLRAQRRVLIERMEK